MIVCCVNVANYQDRGAEYVNALYRGVQRHLPGPHAFICFADHATPAGAYDPGITLDQRLGQFGFSSWWAKMWLFSPYAFALGERVLYIDLDTLIVGPLDDIAAYDGPFALLEDLFFPGQWGSGLMSWVVNERTRELYRRYVELSYPVTDPRGDQGFLMDHLPRDYVDLWQDVCPAQIQSYKAAGGILLPTTRVVCFHGRPRPHEVTTGWVPALWREGEAV